MRLGLSMLEERSQQWQEKEGQGVEAHLVVSRSRRRTNEEKCVRERGSGLAFIVVLEGWYSFVPLPWVILLPTVSGWLRVVCPVVGSVFPTHTSAVSCATFESISI